MIVCAFEPMALTDAVSPTLLEETHSLPLAHSIGVLVPRLLRFALDSNASSVNVSVDFPSGYCCFEDDSDWMGLPDHSIGDSLGPFKATDAVQAAGSDAYRWNFLVNLSTTASVTITSSKQANVSDASELILQNGKVLQKRNVNQLSSSSSELAQRDARTRITVRDLFTTPPYGSRRYNASSSDTDEQDPHSLKIAILSLLLAWDRPVALDLTVNGVLCSCVTHERRSQTKQSKRLDTDRIKDLFVQFADSSFEMRDTWVPLKSSKGPLRVRGVINTVPVATQQHQYLSFHELPLQRQQYTDLFETLNSIFERSDFGTAEQQIPTEADLERRKRDRRYKVGEVTGAQLRKKSKATQRWPMFCIRVELRDQSIVALSEASLFSFRKGHREHTQVVNLLGESITEWLKMQSLRP